MKKKNTTVYEDQEAKRQKYADEHFIECPHCGQDVLDHMRQCPHCGGKLTPKGYQPLSDKQIKKIKIIGYAIGLPLAIGLVILYFLVLKK